MFQEADWIAVPTDQDATWVLERSRGRVQSCESLRNPSLKAPTEMVLPLSSPILYLVYQKTHSAVNAGAVASVRGAPPVPHGPVGREEAEAARTLTLSLPLL